jgi:hypothetical protein
MAIGLLPARLTIFQAAPGGLKWKIGIEVGHAETCPPKSSMGVPAVEVCVKQLIVA